MLYLYPVGFLQVIQDLERIITQDTRAADGTKSASFAVGGERLLANLWTAFLFLLKEASPDSGVEFSAELKDSESRAPHRSSMRAVGVSEDGVSRLQSMNDAFQSDFAALEDTRRALVQRKQEQQARRSLRAAIAQLLMTLRIGIRRASMNCRR